MGKHVSNYNAIVVVSSMVGSVLMGYQSGIIGSTLGQVSWYNELGLTMVPTMPGYNHTTTIISASNGVFFASCIVGCIAISRVMNTAGRIRAFQFGIFWHIVGSVIQTASVNQGMFLVGRGLTGVAVGCSAVTGPTYLAEIAPPLSRGLMAGMHGSGQNTGYFLAAWIGFGCSYSRTTTTFGFRFPLAVPILLALLLLASTLWLPESPRWLISKDRTEDAMAVLTRLHKDKRDSDNTFAQREYREILGQLALEKEAQGSTSNYRLLLTHRTYLIRVLLAILVTAGIINTGVLVINNYAVLIYTSLGLSNTMALLLSAVWLSLATIYNYIGAYYSDRVGRKRSLVIGYAGNIICLALFTAFLARFEATNKKGYATAAVFFNFLYEFFFGLGIDPHAWAVVAEIFPAHLRADGSCIAIVFFYIYNVVWSEASPTAFVNIGWKSYLIFICLSTLQAVLIYFFLPEVAGVPLEEIDELFGKSVAIHLEDVDVKAEATPSSLASPSGDLNSNDTKEAVQKGV